MSIFLLRHCERDKNPHFHSSLTTYGLKEAEKLVEQLKTYDFVEIYTSPFLRTLQTIAPYSKLSGTRVRVENAIYECIREPYFEADNFRFGIDDIKKYNDFDDIVDYSYTSKVPLEQIQCTDDLSVIYDRIKPFIDDMIINCETDGCNRLLVTHRTTYNIILNYIKYGRFINEDPTYKPKEGELTECVFS